MSLVSSDRRCHVLNPVYDDYYSQLKSYAQFDGDLEYCWKYDAKIVERIRAAPEDCVKAGSLDEITMIYDGLKQKGEEKIRNATFDFCKKMHRSSR